jgi:hypothetical protein
LFGFSDGFDQLSFFFFREEILFLFPGK